MIHYAKTLAHAATGDIPGAESAREDYLIAKAVYHADLGFDNTLARACQHPNNVWSLQGLHECLTRQGRQEELMLIKPALDTALARADVDIQYSCFCRSM